MGFPHKPLDIGPPAHRACDQKSEHLNSVLNSIIDAEGQLELMALKRKGGHYCLPLPPFHCSRDGQSQGIPFNTRVLPIASQFCPNVHLADSGLSLPTLLSLFRSLASVLGRHRADKHSMCEEG